MKNKHFLSSFISFLLVISMCIGYMPVYAEENIIGNEIATNDEVYNDYSIEDDTEVFSTNSYEANIATTALNDEYTSTIWLHLHKDGTLEVSSKASYTGGYGGLNRTLRIDGDKILSNTESLWGENNFSKVIIPEKINPVSTDYWFNNQKWLSLVEGLENIENIENRDIAKMFGNTPMMQNNSTIPHAMVYSDGTMVFQNSNFIDSTHGYPKGIYTGFEKRKYAPSSISQPNDTLWQRYQRAITTVIFEDEVAPISTAFWFNCLNLSEIINIDKLDTSNTTTMRSMFAYTKVKSLDLSTWDTRNVKDIVQMFYYSQVEDLNLSGWDTSNVTNMTGTFSSCDHLKSLDVSHFKTSNVTSMEEMFRGSSVSELDLTAWDTSNVTDMEGMFQQCKKLKSLDLSSFNTSNVTSMAYMFLASGLENLDLSSFNTEKVTTMYYMLYNMPALKTLDISSFDTSKTYVYNMLPANGVLETIKIGEKFTFNGSSDKRTVNFPVPETESQKWYNSRNKEFDYNTVPNNVADTYSIYKQELETGEYQINYFQENLSGSYELTKSETKEGYVGDKVSVEPDNIDGFTVSDDSNLSGVINNEDGLVLNIYYNRNHYVCTLNPTDGDLQPGEETLEVVYGYQYTLPVPVRMGYQFEGWYIGDELVENEYSHTVLNDVEFTARWTPLTDTPYKVEYYQKTLSGDYELKETVSGTATTDTSVTADAKTYKGFELKTEDLSGVVTGDGLLTIKLYYDRTKVSVVVDNGKDEPAATEIIFGEIIEEPDIPEKEGYTSDGWVDVSGNKVDFTKPLEDSTTIKPNYIPNGNTPYAVKHFVKGLDGEYTLKDTVPASGTTGTQVVADVKQYTGFRLVTEGDDVLGTILPDGSLVIELYYDRIPYIVSFNANEGTLAEGTVDQTVLFEGTATIPANPSRSGYNFAGWYTVASGGTQFLATTPVTADIEVFAHWNRQSSGGGSYVPSSPRPTTPPVEELVDPETPLNPGMSFDDVSIADWYYEKVNEAVRGGFIDPESDSKFNPQGPLDRKAMAKMLAVFKKGDLSKLGDTYDYVDVNKDTRYHAEIAYCNDGVLMMGYGHGQFGPDDILTREQMAIILYRILQNSDQIKLDEKNLDEYNFDDVSKWAREAVEWTVKAGIMVGDENKNLNPRNPVSRAEASTLIIRVVEILGNEKNNKPVG